MGPPTIAGVGVGGERGCLLLGLCWLPLDLLPLAGLPCLASVGERALSLACCVRVGWYPGLSLPFPEKEQRGRRGGRGVELGSKVNK